MPTASYGSLPFKEQIAFLRRKINLPTESWTDLYQEAHDHGFVVAGANRDALVADFHAAIDRAAAGGTLASFREDFDSIVAKHGWSYNGSRNWRSRVIYETNMQTSRAAGRYKQLQAIKATRPYWEFHHTPVANPRSQHVAWNGLILPADDPWWQTHYPPNGWGCQCVVYSRSESHLKKLGKTVPDQAPPVEWETKTVGTNGPAPREVRVPKGVDPGFAYTPGATAWGKNLSANAFALGQAIEAGGWERLAATDWSDYGRPKNVPLAEAPALGTRLETEAQMRDALRDLLGGEEAFFRPGGVPVTAVAQTLAEHVKPDRSEYLPLLIDTLKHPYEVWASLERKGSYYALRVRAIKAYKLPGRGGAALMVADGGRGFMQGWTFLPIRQRSYLRNQRVGVLLHGE